jgi:hypothetical protein
MWFISIPMLALYLIGILLIRLRIPILKNEQ